MREGPGSSAAWLESQRPKVLGFGALRRVVLGLWAEGGSALRFEVTGRYGCFGAGAGPNSAGHG